MKIICILQNAWGDAKLPLIFAPSTFNKSAKAIKKVCGDNKYHFANTTGVVTVTANGKPKIDPKHFKKVIKRLQSYDIILVCGKQAAQAVNDEMKAFEKLGLPIIFIPHPASRDLRNTTLQKARNLINEFETGGIESRYLKLFITNDLL